MSQTTLFPGADSPPPASKPFQSVKVHFKSSSDRERFAKLVGARLTDAVREMPWSDCYAGAPRVSYRDTIAALEADLVGVEQADADLFG
jgi:hypothetical protein